MIQPQMSDQELRRLAAILQEQRGEGLAFINREEAGLLSALGGSGEPMPGTSGLGVGKGPIRSYWPWDDDDDDGDDDNGYDESLDTDVGADTIDDVTGHPSEYIPPPPPPPPTDDDSTTTTAPPPPPRYYDKLGREHSTQALATAADTRIDTQRASLQSLTFTNLMLDSTWDQFKTEAANYADLPESEVEARFNTQLTLAVDQSRMQILNFSDVLSQQLQTLDQSALVGLTWDQVSQSLTGYEGVDDAGAAIPDRLSEEFRRGLFKTMLGNAVREARFTLTPEEVSKFASDAVQMAPVADMAAPQFGEIADAQQVAVGQVAEPEQVQIQEIEGITQESLQQIEAGVDTVIELITDRYTGKAKSPAQEKLRQNTEQNLLMLMGTAAGGEVSPARVRQLRQLQADLTQAATADAALQQSQEQQASEQQLVTLYTAKSTLRLQSALANLEVRKQTAFKQGDLDLARELAIQETKLTRVITKASLDKDVELANLETRRLKAINQGKMDLATLLANFEKDQIISRTNAELSLKSRALDHALALAAYQGEMALEGVEVQIDLAEMENDLKIMGFELTRDLAEMDDATKRYIAGLTGQYKDAENDTNRQSAIMNMIAVGIATYAKLGSDIGMKREIRAADDQVEGFLDALQAYQYQYKDPSSAGQSPGTFVGVMAQDLEKSPMGASFVSDTPHGKMVDYGHGLAAILASQSNLHDRLKRLED